MRANVYYAAKSFDDVFPVFFFELHPQNHRIVDNQPQQRRLQSLEAIQMHNISLGGWIPHTFARGVAFLLALNLSGLFFLVLDVDIKTPIFHN